jgi:hypothetical protein
MHRSGSPTVPLASLALLGLSVATGGLAACLQQVSTGTGTTDTTATTAATTTSAGSDVTPTGAGCQTDAVSGITLCEESSECPTIDVDQSVMPGCGFRIRTGGVIDLECLCSGELCPVGIADTCDEALALLNQEQSAVMVCEQVSESRCLDVTSDAAASTATTTTTTTPTTTGSTSGSTTAAGSCDKVCESECAGEPDCIQLCGC